MVKQSALIGIGVSIAILVGVTIFCIVKYFKKEHVVSAILWGILTFFIYNAFSNILSGVLASVLFKSQEAVTEFLSGSDSLIPAALFSAVVATLAFTASALIVTMIQRKRGKVNELTAEMTGTFSGLFGWVNPLQGMILYFVNLLMYGFAINSGSFSLTPSETITQEQIDAFINELTHSTADKYIVLALMYVVLLIMYRTIFKLVDRALESKKSVPLKTILAGTIYFVSYLALLLLTTDTVFWAISVVGILIVGGVLIYLSDYTQILKG